MNTNKNTKACLSVAFLMASFFVSVPGVQGQVSKNPAIEPFPSGNVTGSVMVQPPPVNLNGDSMTPAFGPNIHRQDNIMATTSVYGSKIVSQEGNRIKLSFGIVNSEGVQSQIHYAIQLLKIDKNGYPYPIHEQVESEVFDIGPGEKNEKEVTYVAPDFLTGKYQLSITLKNNNNLNLGFSTVGDVTLPGSGEYLEIIPETCFLTVEGEGGVKYSLVYGIDVDKTEQLFLHCQVKNHFNQEVSAIPSFKNYWRSSAGKEVSSLTLDPIVFQPNADTVIKLLIPKADEPQAYDAVFSLLNGKQALISNSTTTHYVLRGVSATIQNLVFDKDYYVNGDAAKILFFWTPAASAFQGSRKNNAEDQIEAQLFIAISSNGQECSDGADRIITKSEQNVKINIPITKDCVNPEARVSIKDRKGNVLDEGVFAVTSQDVSKKKALMPNASQQEERKISTGQIALAVAALIAFLGIVAAYAIKKRSNKILPIFWLAALCTLLSGTEVRAAGLSWNLPATDENGVSTTAYYTVDFRDNAWNVYEPGGLVTIDTTGSGGGCSNGWGTNGLITQSYDGVQTLLFQPAWGPGDPPISPSKTHQFYAPSTPGVYRQGFVGLAYFGPNDDISLRWQYYNWQSIPYYVLPIAKPTITPRCDGVSIVWDSKVYGIDGGYQVRIDNDQNLDNGFWYRNVALGTTELTDAPNGFVFWDTRNQRNNPNKRLIFDSRKNFYVQVGYYTSDGIWLSGGWSGSSTLSALNCIPTLSFSATQPNIVLGQEARLQWTVANTDWCWAQTVPNNPSSDDGWTDNTQGNWKDGTPGVHSQFVRPTVVGTYTYTLKCGLAITGSETSEIPAILTVTAECKDPIPAMDIKAERCPWPNNDQNLTVNTYKTLVANCGTPNEKCQYQCKASAGYRYFAAGSPHCQKPITCPPCKAWNDCTRICGGGTHERICYAPNSSNTACQELPAEPGSCNTQTCPPDWVETKP